MSFLFTAWRQKQPDVGDRGSRGRARSGPKAEIRCCRHRGHQTRRATAAAALISRYRKVHLASPACSWDEPIIWGDSDIDDYRRYPLRIVSHAPPTFEFQTPTDEMWLRYSPAWKSFRAHVGNARASETFAQFLEDTDT